MGKKSKVAAAASAVAAVQTGLNLYNDYRGKWYARRTYTAAVPEDSFIFRPLLLWVNNHVHTRHVRFYSTRTKIQRLYDSEGRTEVNINGKQLFVALKKPQLNLDGPISFDTAENPLAKSLVFTTYDPSAIDVLEEFLKEMTAREATRAREIYVYRPGTYGWNVSDFPYRNIDSVFLADNNKEEIMADIETFLEGEEKYQKRGIPWHRGYLLYGPPGNGKTSLSASLAHRYKLNMYNMPLSTVKDDKMLTDLVASIEPNSILLLEDLDIFSKSVSRDEENDSGPTLAGLLNALDGVTTPSGLITFMCTNKPDSLDYALVRPGRVDFRLELRAPDNKQIEDMFMHMYGEPLNGEPGEFSSMAAVTDVFKRNLDDVETARHEVLTARGR